MRKRTTKKKTGTTGTRGRRRSAAGARGSGRLVNFFIPVVFIAGIVFCLGFLLVMGYRSVTASAFFEVKKIEIRGTDRTPGEQIENIVRRQAARSGVWNADLALIKKDIENLIYVKTAAVSRVLPDGVRVIVVERTPQAVVRLKTGDHWVDEEGFVLGRLTENDQPPPFVLLGWDESKSLSSLEENRHRVRIYRQMLQEWQDFELAKRVSVVNLENPEQAEAFVTDSGESVRIILGKENYGRRLRDALKAIANKGKEIESFDVQNSVARPRES